ncbi:GDP-mannose-dependent alpha-mannosyltransferase [Mycobacterium kiyosense]|uniref:GDP-mannose-dependent alpha-mannosyltransferase n=1 Tax=Mycobacterium kiyosense TaxID=2871094 RepID=A0A9P3Q6Q7_9MYCO|nr:GDP-mannose-dependent alpha-mannosyltransferase [Mycobacterium kiyosense]BDE12266.1 GDP-mannose-dependent alpha-mannosyltransferase [Mycobacterium sp. 20KCMC460]GLB85128.1 GDP-mannose-dependent alpha-mannosyltransferase [Mycobacterium kiyosense]GLB88504.1 GDP-mannose-dependent alpha-mannosyltransferase [Mycobacterium kiyosense]GLB94867.1 GDP-mannose-dependent alpha-mannosyltransferase [Mycobacterium kiyosense]
MVGVRVAIVAESFLPQVNGVSNSVIRVLEHLRRTGHEALVIAPDNPPGEPRAERLHDGVRVHRTPSRMFPKVTTLPLGVPTVRMLRALRGFDPDVVHLASPALLGYGGLRAARRLGVPTVAVYQTDVPGFAASYGIPTATRAAWAWFRHLHGLADRTLAPSTPTMEVLAAQGFPRLHRWGRGVDLLRYAPSARDETLRRRWSPDGRPIVGFVGRLAPEKHVERLAALAADGGVRLVVVGDGVDRAKLQSLLPTAVFTGALYGDELAAAYASMDVFVHPGEHETFCQVVQEALASGLPVIAPDAGGPRDLIAPSRTGLLLPVEEFEARLPGAVAYLLADRPRYAQAARRSVLGRSWPVICDELLGHYEAVLSPAVRARTAVWRTRRA